MQAGEVLQDPKIIAIAESHKVSQAQVIIRWHIQSGLIVIPKSVHAERIKENFDVFNFELSGNEMDSINGMEEGKRIGPDPDTANFS